MVGEPFNKRSVPCAFGIKIGLYFQKTLEGEKLPKVLFFSKIWLKYRVLWHFEF